MRFRVQWLDTASDDVRDWGDYVARQTSKRNALQLVRRLEGKVNEALAWSPQRYAPAPEWGEGVRRLPELGRRVLFDVDEARAWCAFLPWWAGTKSRARCADTGLSHSASPVYVAGD